MSSAEEGEVPPLTKAAEILQHIAKPVIDATTLILPYIIKVIWALHDYYVKLPVDAARFLVGFVFCFFGGMYPTIFAAIQAAKHGGLMKLKAALKDMTDEAIVIIEESKKDDSKDEDKDGVADVNQIDSKEYIMRKVNLVLTKMNPGKFDKALTSIYTVWISVLATLKIQFARTIALALTISDFLSQPVDRFIAPTIKSAVPKDYQRWVPVILSWITKSIAMSIAWYIQTIISAFTSAVEGGLIMARTVHKVAVDKGITLGGLVPERHEETSFDEFLSYIFAGLGFYFQFKMGFDMPFPFNLLLWPFELLEYYIRWTITD